jgi:large subunit ribosomal protein L15
MNQLSKLAPKSGSRHSPKRVGRGKGSGLGQTAGKGHKGQLARTGGKVRRGFEGGQTPLVRRLPKFGFTPLYSAKDYFDVINLSQLNEFSGVVTIDTLKKAGIIHKDKVKLLGNGKLDKKLTITVDKASAAAKKAVESIGGTLVLTK